VLAGLKKSASPGSSNEFVATGSRDKTIKIWDGRGTLIKTFVGHDNWIKSIVFHPAGKYLLSCSDDKTIRCWDLSQDGRCVKVIDAAHAHFVTCMKWAPSPPKVNPGSNGLKSPGTNDGELPKTNGTPVKKKTEPPESINIRCVLATGSVDLSLKIWAS